MYDELVKRLRAEEIPLDELVRTLHEAADAIEELSKAQEQWIEQERNVLLKSIPKWVSVTDIEHLPNTDSGVVGYFGGGAFDQLRWYDFVCTTSDGTLVGENTERDVMNDHCIAVYKLPEPPKEET